MDLIDIVSLLDRKQAVEPTPCPNEGKQVKTQFQNTDVHGHMTVHKSGSYLVCGVCGEKAPVGRVD